jgi:hypothetical protein
MKETETKQPRYTVRDVPTEVQPMIFDEKEQKPLSLIQAIVDLKNEVDILRKSL